MRIKCLKINQPIGEFYLAVIKSSFLKKVCYTKTANFDSGDIAGAQRESNAKSLNEIKNYVQTENAAIPNSIILAANYTPDDNFLTEPSEMWEIEEENDPESDEVSYYLNVPDENLKACAIVDGQHRLRGIIESGTDIELPCSIFIDLPPSLQALVFATINFNQKPVDKSLAYQLFGYQLDDSKSSLWTPDILAVQLSRLFNGKGPFKKRIRLIKTKKSLESPPDWSISSAAFIAGVSSLISSNLNKDKYTINKKTLLGVSGRKSLSDNAKLPLRRYYIDGNDKAIQIVLERYFNSMERYLWSGRECTDIIFRTVGISAQFKFLKFLLQNDNEWKNNPDYFYDLLKNLDGLNFDSDYFLPRTATTASLVNAFKLKLGMIESDGLDRQILDACALGEGA